MKDDRRIDQILESWTDDPKPATAATIQPVDETSMNPSQAIEQLKNLSGIIKKYPEILNMQMEKLASMLGMRGDTISSKKKLGELLWAITMLTNIEIFSDPNSVIGRTS